MLYYQKILIRKLLCLLHSFQIDLLSHIIPKVGLVHLTEMRLVGRNAYKEKEIQLLLNSNPEKQIRLSGIKKEVLVSCKPIEFNGVELYEVDPILKIMKYVADKNQLYYR